MLHRLALKIAEIIATELNLSQKKAAIAYGLEIIVNEVVKLLWNIAVPYLLGILPQALTAYIVTVVMRMGTGGTHCTGYYRCLVVSLVIFCGIGYLGRHTAGHISNTSLPWLGVFTGLTALASILRYAPVNSLTRPVIDPLHRKRLKVLSVVLLASFISMALLAPLRTDIALVIFASILFQSHDITPTGRKLMHCIDRLFIFFEGVIPRKGGVRHEN